MIAIDPTAFAAEGIHTTAGARAMAGPVDADRRLAIPGAAARASSALPSPPAREDTA